MSDQDMDVKSQEDDNLLVSLDTYLANGIHVGLKYKTADMKPFIYKVRSDKLCVFDVQKINERLKVAAHFIASYDPKDVLVVSNRVYGRTPIKQFAESIGCQAFTDRFISGSLTNPNIKSYAEPSLLIVTDPTADKQAINEAAKVGVTVIGICDTNTFTKNIDFIIPSNNKGKNALGLVYWILANEVNKIKGAKFTSKLEDFISTAEPQPYLLAIQEQQRAKRRKNKRRR